MTLDKREVIVTQLFETATRAQRHFESVLKDYGLRFRSYRFLRALAQYPDGLTVGELREMAGTSQSDMTRVLDGLELNGLVSRRHSSQDRRSVVAFITEEGRCRLGEVEERTRSVCGEITRFMDESDVIGFAEHMRTVLDAIEEVV